jgi:hypothetical protein
MELENTRTDGDGLAGKPGWRALATGAVGAATVTLAHEVVRKLVPHPPRMDLLGMTALTRVLHAAGASVPRGGRLRAYTLLGDLAGNALFYAPLARRGKRPLLRGLALGALAGLGAVVLAPALGLPRRHRGITLRTQAMTVALYAFGGVAAGAMASWLYRPTRARALGARVVQDPHVALRSGVEPQTGEW